MACASDCWAARSIRRHEGHLYVSETALRQLKLDYVWWLVSSQNPLKSGAGMAALAVRMEEARTVAAHHPHLIVTDLKTRFPRETNYTADTVAALRRRFPEGVDFVWLMGGDNLAQFGRWRRWQRNCPPHASGGGGATSGHDHGGIERDCGAALWHGAEPYRLRTGAHHAALDGARNPESATRLRALGSASAEAMLDMIH